MLNIISLLKYLKHVISSFGVGLSWGGTHFNTGVMYELYSFKPSFIWSELGWLDSVTWYIQLIRKSADLSPVKTLPVLLPPCAAGAKPTINNLAFFSF